MTPESREISLGSMKKQDEFTSEFRITLFCSQVDQFQV